MDGGFKSKTLARRLKMHQELLDTYPTRVAVIVEPSTPLGLDRTKYLVPHDITVAYFFGKLRQNVQAAAPGDALYILWGHPDTASVPSQTMLEVYMKHADEDGFLYGQLMKENAFGAD